EFFDLTIQAFNTAEKFRTPVFVMADQIVAMTSERLRIPRLEDVKISERSVLEPKSFDGRAPFDYSEDFIPMPIAGTGCKLNVDSLTHDSRGFPSIDHSVSEVLTRHLVGKIANHAREIWKWEEFLLEDAEVAVVSYGSSSRSARRAVKVARSRGIKAGLLRLITPWPFPTEVIERVSSRVHSLVVAEINYGQLIHPIREHSRCPVVGANWAPGSLIEPEAILDALQVVVPS
ncbi:MAG: 2-oxoacid:acceptor oxidoreductase subunit alpha, partial [Nitrososphaerota archaeon]|nr:2-oxoacid:acceptor oxidoreductase subunit alpha [Nitrososphaerota archaeon]